MGSGLEPLRFFLLCFFLLSSSKNKKEQKMFSHMLTKENGKRLHITRTASEGRYEKRTGTNTPSMRMSEIIA